MAGYPMPGYSPVFYHQPSIPYPLPGYMQMPPGYLPPGYLPPGYPMGLAPSPMHALPPGAGQQLPPYPYSYTTPTYVSIPAEAGAMLHHAGPHAATPGHPGPYANAPGAAIPIGAQPCYFSAPSASTAAAAAPTADNR